MDSHPHPAAAAGAALVVPDASALRALSDSDALHTLDTYLWGAMQLSAILRERLLHDSKERDTSTSSLHKPGPRVRDVATTWSVPQLFWLLTFVGFLPEFLNYSPTL